MYGGIGHSAWRSVMKIRPLYPVAAVLLAFPAARLEAKHPVPGPHYVRCLSDGNVVRIEWDHLGFAGGGLEAHLERDGSFIAELESSDLGYIDRGVPAGAHTYRVVILQGESTLGSSDCSVNVGAGVPPPEAATCSLAEGSPATVTLEWRNPVSYDDVIVHRDGSEVALLDGETTRFSESPGPGLHVYEVRGVILGELSPPSSCSADPGGTPLHRLYLLPLQPSGAGPPASPASDQLAVMLDDSYPVSAWSFGLCSDPDFLVPLAIETGWALERLNLGAGPDFLAIEVHPGGFTMEVIIDENDPTALLDAGTNRLLAVRYGGGPRATPGEAYPLEFCDSLGDPPVSISLTVNGREVEPTTEPGLALASAVRFLRGDSNADAEVNLTDAIFTLDWLFRSGRAPDCVDAADANGSREVDISDPVHALNFLFNGGPAPPAPFPECGTAAVAVGCDRISCP
jgi:hypothetical protein